MMSRNESTVWSDKPIFTVALSALIGITLGAVGSRSLAQVVAPTEHIGITVEALGTVPEESLKAQIGLEEHFLQMRAVTIEPGGQVGKHSHAERPGLVKMISGEWIVGTESGEQVFKAGTKAVIVETNDTVHWVYNRGAEPAMGLVCGITPTS